MRKIIYIGNSVEAVTKINNLKDFNVTAILCDSRKASVAMKNFAESNGIKYIICSTSQQVTKTLSFLHFELIIMYSCSLILATEVIKRYKVYNFHPGDLHSNRGSTPVNWSLVLGERETKIVLYRLSPVGIDLGEVVSERIINIDDEDNVISLRKKLESFIPEMLIELHEFITQNKKGILIESGIYRPRIAEKDYTINQRLDSERIIRKKIKSQEVYDGAILQTSNGSIRFKTWEEYLSFLAKDK